MGKQQLGRQDTALQHLMVRVKTASLEHILDFFLIKYGYVNICKKWEQVQLW